jgi:mono/diheme cytochrome c family protein
MLRILGRILLGLVLVIATAAVAVYLLSQRTLTKRYPVAAEAPLVIPTDSATVAYGRHLFLAVTVCAHCHGVEADGGRAEPPNPVFTMSPPNLTRGQGGIGGSRSVADLERAIRHGVRGDSTSLLVMPSDAYAYLSDTDVAALIAYIQQLPPVDRTPVPTAVGPIGRALLVAGKLPVQVAPRTVAHTTGAASSLDQGRYLANISGCHGCHNAALSGGRVPGEPPDNPPARNLTPTGIGNWTEADFARAVREGKRPDGSTLNTFMPWERFSGMTDAEIQALWEYVRSFPPKETGVM